MNSPGRTHSRAFSPFDWILLVSTVLMGGASPILIKFGLVDLSPETLTWIRMIVGASVIALFPAARVPLVNKRDWGPIVLLSVVWMVAPFLLISVAQQSIDSSLAGMLNGAMPLFTAAIAILWLRARLARPLIVGLIIGFAGVVVISIPNLTGRMEVIGMLLSLTAAALYAWAFNLTGPLQARNSALSVILRAQIVGVVILTPFGIAGIDWTEAPGAGSLISTVLLGMLSTGLGFAGMVVLIGRVGASRASISVYLVPVMAIIFGAWLGAEVIHPVSLFGIALVLAGAYLASRGTRGAPPTKPFPG